MSDLISYALLAGIFVITGLRMFIEKPKKLAETKAMHRQSSNGNEDFSSTAICGTSIEAEKTIY